jgi:phosphate-selective porin OprO/OprP
MHKYDISYGFNHLYIGSSNSQTGKFVCILLGCLVANMPQTVRAQQSSTSSDAATIQALKAQVDALSKKVNAMEDERDQESAVPQNERVKNAATVSAGPNGFEIQSADKQFDLQLKGLLQVQDREFLTPSNNGSAPGDGLYLRRARIMFDGTLWKAYTFRIEPEFGARTGGAGGTSSSTATLASAYFNVDYWDPLQLQVGRFKGPIGYERSQLVANNIWIENGLTQNLTPNYDQALMLHGNVGKIFSYGAGIMEGVRDNASDDIQAMSDNNYDFVGDVYFNPFANSDQKALRGLGFGTAGSVGNRGDVGTASSSPLATYTTPAQTNLLTYNTTGATESEDGYGYRLTPVIYYYYGPLGMYADYAVSSIRALRTVGAASRTTTLHNDAWQVVGSYVLTGENADYANGVKPREDFSIGNHTWGAFQLVARYGELTLDNNYFTSTGAVGSVGGPIATQGPHRTDNIGFGVNWYLNQNIKAQFEYDYDGYTGGKWPVTAANEDQNSFMTQLQLAF